MTPLASHVASKAQPRLRISVEVAISHEQEHASRNVEQKYISSRIVKERVQDMYNRTSV